MGCIFGWMNDKPQLNKWDVEQDLERINQEIGNINNDQVELHTQGQCGNNNGGYTENRN